MLAAEVLVKERKVSRWKDLEDRDRNQGGEAYSTDDIIVVCKVGFAILAAEDLIGCQVDVVCNAHVYGGVGSVQEIAVRHGRFRWGSVQSACSGLDSKKQIKVQQKSWEVGERSKVVVRSRLDYPAQLDCRTSRSYSSSITLKLPLAW